MIANRLGHAWQVAVYGALFALLLLQGAASAQLPPPPWPPSPPAPSRKPSTYGRPDPCADLPPPRNLRLTADPESRARIERALGETTKLTLDDDPLELLQAQIESRHKIPVVLDLKALEDLGVSADTPITKSLQGITLGSALRLVLDEHELAYTIDEGLLVITTKTAAETALYTVVYEVRDLLYDEDSYEPDCYGLIWLITCTVAPQSWEDAGGPGSIACLLDTLVVSATDGVQKQTADLLAALRAARKQMATETGDARYAPIRPDGASAEERIAARLHERIDLDLVEAPLSALASTVASKLAIPVVLDEKAVEDLGLSRDTPVKVRLSGVSARVALKYALGQHELAFVVENESLVITSKTFAECKQVTRVYPVADLLGAGGDDYDALIDAITTTISPSSWEDAGGPGTIQEFEVCECLVVGSTREIQDDVQRLLEALRAAQPPRWQATEEEGPQLRYYRLPLVAVGEERPTAAELRELVMDYVGPQSWSGHGGEGEIRTVGGGLLIRHTRKAHRAVAEFLLEFGVYEFAPPPPMWPPQAPICVSVIPVVGENAGSP